MPLVACALWVAAAAGAADAPTAQVPWAPVKKKLIATGWDSPTPAQFRAHLREFEKWPFDGTTIQPTRTRADGSVVDAKFAFGRDRWEKQEFARAVEDLTAVPPATSRDNFLMLYANPGDVDWFDDAGFANIVEHWRLLAWAAHEGGARGILFDAEPYTPPHAQFGYGAQPARNAHDFAAYCVKARERGREVMRVVAGEFPDITIFSYRLLCDLLFALGSGGEPTTLLETHPYGLLPAFLNGMLDVIPPGATIIEGDENAYSYNSDAEFERAFVDLKTKTLGLIALENRAKFKAQCSVSHGIYLDAHSNEPTSPWYIDPRGGPRAARLEANVKAALRTADEYVWVYGETARWWPSGNLGFPFWPAKLEGADRALLAAKDPLAAACARLGAAAPAENLLKNADFAAQDADGLPKDWWFWQDERSHGTAALDADAGAAGKGAARIAAAENGCLGQGVKVKGGESYAVGVKIRRQGRGVAGVRIRWKTPGGAWTAEGQDVHLAAVEAPAAADAWRFFAGTLTVPESAGELVVLLAAYGQGSAADAIYFDDVQVVGAK